LPRIPFTKAVGCGNDFLIVDRASCPASANLAQLTKSMCDRHEGVGADGVEWISNIDSDRLSLKADLINSDGSAAEISGNGTRCVAAWFVAQQGKPVQSVKVETGAGSKECKLLSYSDDQFEFEMAMSRPRDVHERTVGGQSGVSIDFGNPHFVLFVGSFNFDWQGLAARLQSDTGAFPNGTNIEFVRVIDRHVVEARFFERGAGQTRSSGTGSCASAMAAVFSRLCSSPVTVTAEGGAQVVRVEDQTYLRGPARIICTGEFSISGV
jgi:diaminopimelate epimerase